MSQVPFSRSTQRAYTFADFAQTINDQLGAMMPGQVGEVLQVMAPVQETTGVTDTVTLNGALAVGTTWSTATWGEASWSA